MKCVVFKDEILQREYEREGYIIVDAGSANLASFESFIEGLNLNIGKDFYYSLLSNPYFKNINIHAFIQNELQPLLNHYFSDFRLYSSSFLIKPANKPDEMVLHQDWCFTDEEKYLPVTVWLPLQDVTEENGSQFLIPQSHLWFNNIRSGTYSTGRVAYNEVPEGSTKAIRVKKGQVLLFNPAIWHGSYSNSTNQHRYIVSGIVLPSKAPFLHYYKSSETQADVYNLADDAFEQGLYNLSAGNTPQGTVVEQKEYTHHIVEAAELREKCISNSPLVTGKKGKRFLVDPALQQSFDKNGFITLKLFNETEISSLRNLYTNYFGKNEIKGIYTSHNANPGEINDAVSEDIRSITISALDVVVKDYDFFIAHFVVKQARFPYQFDLHQDWNIVDESDYFNVQIWIPLEATTPENGGLFVLPGSHLFFNNFRSGSYNIPLVKPENDLEKFIRPVNLLPGEVVMFSNALFHGSYPNNKNLDRLAVIIDIKSKLSSAYYFHKDNSIKKTRALNITAADISASLPELEKGNLSANLQTGYISDKVNKVDNAVITSNDLLQKCLEHGLKPYSNSGVDNKAIQVKSFWQRLLGS